MDGIEVSVVIPVHNQVHLLPRAIESALCQGVPLEVIVVDDASTEDVQKAAAPYPVILLRNRENRGAARSRNRGVRAARGRYIAFLDSDDWWEEGKLARQLELIRQTGYVLCCTGRRLVTPEGEKTSHTIGVKPVIRYRDLLTHNMINCSSVLIRRDAALAYPMSHEKYHEDYLTWLRILKKYHFACGINEPLLNYRMSSSGKSGSKLASAYKTFMVYRVMGFPLWKSIACFAAYTFNGLKKYRGWIWH